MKNLCSLVESSDFILPHAYILGNEVVPATFRPLFLLFHFKNKAKKNYSFETLAIKLSHLLLLIAIPAVLPITSHVHQTFKHLAHDLSHCYH